MTWVGRVGLGLAKRQLVSRIRNMGPTVCMTPDFMGLGNHLTLFLWAFGEREAGRDASVLLTDKMEPWLEVFPLLRPMAIHAGEVRRKHHQVSPWELPSSRAHPHPSAEIESFVKSNLLPSTLFKRTSQIPPSTVLINVRRGDYYTNPANRIEFGFNVDSYFRSALDLAQKQEPITAVHVVSDDISWCRKKMEELEIQPPITFASPTDSAAENFYEVSSGRRLIISNSTFSYWAAYVSGVTHGDNHKKVIAPAFFARSRNGERGWELDPRWTVVDDIPGGWDEPETPDESTLPPR